MTKNSKKVRVEIYFILYLAALILLLPDFKKEREVEKNDSIKIGLSVDKSILNLRMLKKNNKNQIIKFDSTNRILFDGNFDNIDFIYTVSDINRGETIELNSNTNTKEQFVINENRENGFVDFTWNPNIDFNFNKTYLVKLTATAEKDGRTRTATTQFTLNTLFINEVVDNQALNSENEITDFSFLNTPMSIPTNLSNIDVRVSQNPIITVADNEWENYATIYNISSIDDLVGPPEVKIYGDSLLGGTARFVSSEDNQFTFAGISPTYDTMKVNVKITRKVDNSSFTFDFLVIPKPRSIPDIPERMYVGENYIIDTKLNQNDFQNTSTVIKSGSNQKEYKENRIKFTPTDNMLDENLILIRYVNNKKLDQYILNIKNKPKPVVENVFIDDGRITIKTKTFSLKRNSNYIELIDNNKSIKFEEVIGKSYYDDNYQFQTFVSTSKKITREIEIQLIDRNKNKSIKKQFIIK
jgi:hypothetical protein